MDMATLAAALADTATATLTGTATAALTGTGHLQSHT